MAAMTLERSACRADDYRRPFCCAPRRGVAASLALERGPPQGGPSTPALRPEPSDPAPRRHEQSAAFGCTR